MERNERNDMANKSLFGSIRGALIAQTDSVNEEQAPAYRLSPKHALAQYAATGCLSSTFYASATQQLESVLSLTRAVDPEFVAKTAIYCREQGFMKDMPALLCAVLSARDTKLLEQVFGRVIDSGKMLRNFVQIIRSGVAGRKSLGTAPRRMVRDWLDSRADDSVFFASVGQSPSLGDVIKMVHPKPGNDARKALYAYLIGRDHDREKLPKLVHDYEGFKAGTVKAAPAVPFEMLTALPIGATGWAAIARNATWQQTRMNLNAFARHGVFEVPGLTRRIAARLSDHEAIKKARVFPYQLMTASAMADDRVPNDVRQALTEAMEVATRNVPEIEGKVYVCPDASGSMSMAATGYRKGATSVVRCIDVAALVTATILRKNPSATVIPFEHEVVKISLDPADAIMENARKLASIGGGGTSCSAPLALLNKQKAEGDIVIVISDNQSWKDVGRGLGTQMMAEWKAFKRRNSSARMVCIDIQPYGTTQANESEDILNIGGFSDHVFRVVHEFAAGRLNSSHWVGVIESIKL
jgi:60 kDa SS-A/Ro ribonucleoprotein